MTTAHYAPCLVRILEEASFASGVGTNWSSSGTQVYALTRPGVENLKREIVENERIRERVLDQPEAVHTLARGEMPIGFYMHGSPDAAAEGDSATITNYPLAILIRCAMGGQFLGPSAGLASGTVSAPVVDAGQGALFSTGDYVWAYDASADRGEFYQVVSVATDTLTLDRDLFFEPDAGGADTLRAVIDFYVDGDAITQPDHANHKTIAAVIAGAHPTDVFEIAGVKLAIEFDPIAPGQLTKLNCSAMVTIHDKVARPTFGSSTLGSAGSVPSVATTTLVKIADAEGELATTITRGPITPKMGITYDRSESVGGTEGVQGHVGKGWESIGCEFQVDWSTQWFTDWNAHTHKSVMVQIGTRASQRPWGMTWPRLEIHEEPGRADNGGLAGLKIMGRALERAVSVSGLSADDAMKIRSPVHVLVIA